MGNRFWLVSGFRPFQYSYEVISLDLQYYCFVGLLYLFSKLTATYPAMYLTAFFSIAVGDLPWSEAEDV